MNRDMNRKLPQLRNPPPPPVGIDPLEEHYDQLDKGRARWSDYEASDEYTRWKEAEKLRDINRIVFGSILIFIVIGSLIFTLPMIIN